MSKITCKLCGESWKNAEELQQYECSNGGCINMKKKPPHIKVVREKAIKLETRLGNYNIPYDKTKAVYYDDIPKPIYAKVVYA